MHALPAAVLLCFASGLALVCAGWPRKIPLASDLLLKLSLAPACGFGLFSILFFLCLTFSFSRLILADGMLLGLLLTIVFWIRWRQDSVRVAPVEVASAGVARVPRGETAGWIGPALAASFAFSLIIYFRAAIAWMRANPHGIGWDAFAIWNLHARFLYLGSANWGGTNWKDGFSPLISWSHPDYPLLLPAGVAHFWTNLGSDSPLVPAIVSLIFAFSTIALLFEGLSALRGRFQGFIGGLALMGTPYFVERGSSQYADVPLGFFFLSTTVLLCLNDDPARRGPGLTAMAGVTAGFAAWTKNEGLLFLCAVLLAQVLVLARKDLNLWRRQTAPMLAGAIPILLVIGYFKLRVAPAGDLFADGHSIFHKLLEPSRYWVTARWFWKELFSFGRWWKVPGTVLLTGYYFMVGRQPDSESGPGARTSAIALSLILAGYFAIYVITPKDIDWHLRFSLSRLFLQLWPSAIFLFFRMVRAPEQALEQAAGHSSND